MKRTLLTIIYLLVSFYFYGQRSMSVNDPQEWWDSEGSIENLEINIKPSGVFAEVSYTFDIIAPGNNYNSDTQLEWVMHFHMDENVVINDSWLWIENYISKGVIYDKQEGRQIYEGIVNRREDPSILLKNSDTRYEFRVYPLFQDSTRKVKLSYLTPMEINQSEASIPLNLSLFRSDVNQIEQATITIEDSQNWLHVQPQGDIIYSGTNNLGSSVYTLNDFGNNTLFSLDYFKSDSNDYFFGTYKENGTDYFHLSYFPKPVPTIRSNYHLIAIDYADYNTSLELEPLLQTVQSYMKKNYNDNDYFNILYSNSGVDQISEQWLSASSSNIENAINTISENINDESDLRQFFNDGFSFIEENGQEASFTIISSDNENGQEDVALELNNEIEEMIAQVSIGMQLNIVDIADENRAYNYINNTYYSGNDYLYQNINSITDGQYFYGYNYYLFASDNLTESERVFESQTNVLRDFNFDVQPSDGFSFGNYYNAASQDRIKLDRPISLVGKYHGDFPFEVNFKGIHEGEFFDQSFVISDSESYNLDELAAKSWFGQYILANEKTEDYNTAQEVIETSKNERILSRLTTFLCLEPDSIPQTFQTINNEELVIATEEVIDEKEVGINIYPNPFSEFVTVSIPQNFSKYKADLKIEIFDASGLAVDVSSIEINLQNENYVLKWEPSKSIATGMYIIRVSNKTQVINLKAIYIN